MTKDPKIKMEVAREIAHFYFQMDELENAYEILNDTVTECSNQVTFYGKFQFRHLLQHSLTGTGNT